MKPTILILLLAGGPVAAQSDTTPNPTKLLNALMQANAAKDAAGVQTLLKQIAEVGESSKSADEVDPLAKELAHSVKLCKGNWGVLKEVVQTLGALRSKASLGALKRIAFRKKVKRPEQEDVQAAAIDAVGMLRDPRQIKALGDLTKHQKIVIAKAAYASFKHYGPSKGRVRRGIAELLMKRLSAEHPGQGQSGKQISASRRERWKKLERVIVTSMQAICRQDTINDVDNWTEWWRENKKNPKTWRDKDRKG